MNAWTRGCLAALSLIAASAPMTWAATENPRPGHTASLSAPQDTRGIGGEMALAAGSRLSPNADRLAGAAGGMAASASRLPVQGGNNFNWLGGGGG